MNNFTKVIAAALAAATITISAGTTSVSASTRETACDSQFLNDMGVCPDRWGGLYTEFHWEEVSGTADGAWAKIGVRSVTNYYGKNDYYINGQKVSQSQAYDYAANKLGKTYDKDHFFPKDSGYKFRK